VCEEFIRCGGFTHPRSRFSFLAGAVSFVPNGAVARLILNIAGAITINSERFLRPISPEVS
jgi:hypothetical protein